MNDLDARYRLYDGCDAPVVFDDEREESTGWIDVLLWAAAAGFVVGVVTISLHQLGLGASLS